MLWLIVDVVGSAVVGGLAGHFMRCRNGVCILFSSWKSGLAVGALIGLLNGLQFLER
jgi:hypothetical protein